MSLEVRDRERHRDRDTETHRDNAHLLNNEHPGDRAKGEAPPGRGGSGRRGGTGAGQSPQAGRGGSGPGARGEGAGLGRGAVGSRAQEGPQPYLAAQHHPDPARGFGSRPPRRRRRSPDRAGAPAGPGSARGMRTTGPAPCLRAPAAGRSCGPPRRARGKLFPRPVGAVRWELQVSQSGDRAGRAARPRGRGAGRGTAAPGSRTAPPARGGRASARPAGSPFLPPSSTPSRAALLLLGDLERAARQICIFLLAGCPVVCALRTRPTPAACTPKSVCHCWLVMWMERGAPPLGARRPGPGRHRA